MNLIPHRPARGSSRPAFALLSVLALLALACFPVLAQAEESSGVQYETAVPTVTGKTKPPQGSNGGSPAKSSTSGATATTGSGSASGSGSSSGGASSANNPSTGSGGGTGQGSPGNGSTAANGQGSGQGANGVSQGQPLGSQTTEDDSSSPLVPILIAVAALAAISIGAVALRQRRQRRSPGAQVSPKAS